MHVARLPRRLFYTFPGGAEIEYPTDIPTPVPKIKCDEVSVPSQRASYHLWRIVNGTPFFFSSYTACSQPVLSVHSFPFPSNPAAGHYARIDYQAIWTGCTWQTLNTIPNFSTAWYWQGSTPLAQPDTRRDLLIGDDRLVNPILNTPCPGWRLAGGNCPEGSQDCGNCCLDCSAVKSAIEGLTASASAVSNWRKKI